MHSVHIRLIQTGGKRTPPIPFRDKFPMQQGIQITNPLEYAERAESTGNDAHDTPPPNIDDEDSDDEEPMIDDELAEVIENYRELPGDTDGSDHDCDGDDALNDGDDNDDVNLGKSGGPVKVWS